jgi:hypothetical protein
MIGSNQGNYMSSRAFVINGEYRADLFLMTETNSTLFLSCKDHKTLHARRAKILLTV